MEPHEAYIDQARQQGQTDEQIRQALLVGGWSVKQVNAVLKAPEVPAPVAAGTPPSDAGPLLVATVQPATEVTSTPVITQPNSQPINAQQTMPASNQQQVAGKQSSRLPVAVVCLVLLLIVIAGSSYAIFGRKTTYQTAVQEFITAMQNNDKAKVYAFESPAFKAESQKYDGTTNFYTACQEEGLLCTASFKQSYLSKATKTYENYTATDGTNGKAVVYTIKESINYGGPGCSSNSVDTLSIDVIPKANSWLVDNLGDNSNSTGKFCSTSGSSSSVGS